MAFLSTRTAPLNFQGHLDFLKVSFSRFGNFVISSLAFATSSLKEVDLCMASLKGTQWIVSVEVICSKGLNNRLRYSVKRKWHLELSKYRKSNAVCFRKDKNVVLGTKMSRSARIFGKANSAHKFGK